MSPKKRKTAMINLSGKTIKQLVQIARENPAGSKRSKFAIEELTRRYDMSVKEALSLIKSENLVLRDESETNSSPDEILNSSSTNFYIKNFGTIFAVLFIFVLVYMYYNSNLNLSWLSISVIGVAVFVGYHEYKHKKIQNKFDQTLFRLEEIENYAANTIRLYDATDDHLMCELQIEDNGNHIKKHLIYESDLPYIIGRRNPELEITNKTVSIDHLILEFDGDQFFVEDISLNGTNMEGHTLKRNSRIPIPEEKEIVNLSLGSSVKITLRLYPYYDKKSDANSVVATKKEANYSQVDK